MVYVMHRVRKAAFDVLEYAIWFIYESQILFHWPPIETLLHSVLNSMWFLKQSKNLMKFYLFDYGDSEPHTVQNARVTLPSTIKLQIFA